MEVDYDSAKNDWNIAERGLSFDEVVDFDFESALFALDSRRTYPEVRYNAIGYLEDRLHVLCFTPIESGVRVISFRKANHREVKRYEQATD